MLKVFVTIKTKISQKEYYLFHTYINQIFRRTMNQILRFQLHYPENMYIERVIAFYNKMSNDTQKKYSESDKKLLIVLKIKFTLLPILLGIPFLKPDHLAI